MARGLTDLPEEPTGEQPNEELDQIINDLIVGQNKLHDRIIDLERKLDHINLAMHVGEPIGEAKPNSKWWHKGL